jgi:SAM-dependent methyltransferase
VSYDPAFFAGIAGESVRSAKVIVPKFIELVEPRSVVDVGCGKGWFLAEFGELGVTDLLGVDGGPADDLVIPADQYQQVDLTERFAPARRFDLAVCLEVAEHLPESAAEGFIEQLCLLAPVVLFSAAIPMQGGEGHLNERWPDYWQALFARHGYRASGWPRVDIWGDEQVAPYYRQNLLLFASQELDNHKIRYYIDTSPAFAMYRLIHPQILGQKMGVKFL